MATAGFLSGVGDFICQNIEGQTKYDWKRLSIFTLVGGVYIGPMLHMNYSKILPALVPNKGSVTSQTFKKLVID